MIEQHWTKSGYSTGGDANCVEVRSPVPGETVQVRDTQNRPLGTIDLPRHQWTSLLGALRAGRL